MSSVSKSSSASAKTTPSKSTSVKGGPSPSKDGPSGKKRSGKTSASSAVSKKGAVGRTPFTNAGVTKGGDVPKGRNADKLARRAADRVQTRIEARTGSRKDMNTAAGKAKVATYVAPNGKTYVGINESGAREAGLKRARMHPDTQKRLDRVPGYRRSCFHGGCAEVDAENRARWDGQKMKGGEMRAADVGGKKASGEPQPRHGRHAPACETCDSTSKQGDVRTREGSRGELDPKKRFGPDGKPTYKTAGRALKTAGKAAARFVPGANVAMAAADARAAALALADPTASTFGKATAVATAAGSLLAATNIPIVSQVGGAIATASDFVGMFFG